MQVLKVLGRYNIDELTPEHILEKTGIARYELPQLLEAFKEHIENVNSTRGKDNFTCEKAYLEAAPTAFEVYRRLYKSRKVPPVIKQLSSMYKQEPDTLHFWCESASLYVLFDKLLVDRYIVL